MHTPRHKQGLLTDWQTRNWKQDSQGKAFKGPILVLTSDVHAQLLCTSSRTQLHEENPECLGESSTKPWTVFFDYAFVPLPGRVNRNEFILDNSLQLAIVKCLQASKEIHIIMVEFYHLELWH